MADAKRDDNGVPSWLGLSSTDGITPVRILVNSSNGGVRVDTTTTIAFTPRTTAGRDANDVATKLGVQSGANNVLPVYVNPLTGAILVDS